MSELDEIRAAGMEVTRIINRLRALLDFFDELCCEAGRDGYFKWVNSCWEKKLGWTAAELCSKPWLEFVHPDDRPATVIAYQNMEKENVIGFENRYMRKSGGWAKLKWKAVAFNGDEMAYAKAEIIEMITG